MVVLPWFEARNEFFLPRDIDGDLNRHYIGVHRDHTAIVARLKGSVLVIQWDEIELMSGYLTTWEYLGITGGLQGSLLVESVSAALDSGFGRWTAAIRISSPLCFGQGLWRLGDRV